MFFMDDRPRPGRHGHHASEPDAQSAALERAVGPVLEPSPTEWNAMVTEIVGHNPDILVLSEAPPYDEMYRALDRLPGRRFVVSVQTTACRSAHVSLVCLGQVARAADRTRA